jgi:hypothetical protein
MKKLKKKEIDAAAIALNQATNPPAPRRSRGRQAITADGTKLVRSSTQLKRSQVEAIAQIAQNKGITEAEVLRELLDHVLRKHESPVDSYHYEGTEIVREEPEGDQGDRAPDNILTFSQEGQQIRLSVRQLTQLLDHTGYTLIPNYNTDNE